MKELNLRIFALVVAYAVGVAAADAGASPEKSDQQAQHRAESLMRDWQTVTQEELSDPANALAVERMRLEAKESHRTYARVPLLRLGDPQVTKTCLHEFHTKDIGRSTAAQQLRLSGNPLIISLVADDLFREENTDSVFVAPEFRERPVSVHACDIIRGIIATSPAFNESTKLWAASLSTKSRDRDAIRTQMRRWWSENKDAIRGGHYQQVKPPKNK